MTARRDQHFLVDERAVERILSVVEVSGRQVLEVGPGKGVLTRGLLDRGATVTAVEIDPVLVEELRGTFAPEVADGSLQLVEGDAVKVPLPPFELVVSNLPYSISSPMTFRLLDMGFSEAILMFQAEFADKMAARIGTPASGRLTVMVQTFAGVKRCFHVPPNAFSPRPQVHSTVVRITPRDPPWPIGDKRHYADVVRVLFSQRRKTVRNGLKSGRGIFGADRVERMIGSLPAEMLALRPEALSLRDFAAIAAVV
ncbi:MAG TPA: 16S rRNA (adenine(1518)-N(6)/adenine(1519)-N(6))-dimethyltransferase RsmA [Methanomicrobiales archaeon]|jgi:16S rRNA (adenine1518-N6/adenine1519-N6)-dimethyltransferase|nr:16S rRNA (adenine(1518)-N(6)/adenine(1519)-N(6))-dimethyltransferase RsmA [Methanomicrobiales archaeon]